MAPEASSSSPCKSVVVVRHGERIDYVMRDAGQNWIPTATRPWDPPLTERGHEQAQTLGKALPKVLEELNLPPIGVIYSSPFIRCRQTSVGLATGSQSSTDSGKVKVQVELGLAESMNENFFRSWSIPGTDGSWGYKRSEIALADLDVSTLHAKSKEPVQGILDWKQAETDQSMLAWIDSDHVSKSKLDTPYAMHPPQFESFKTQQRRMHQTMELLSQDHLNETIVLVSHGGPVTHLYESVTGNNWSTHGDSKYCCYSVYRQVEGGENWKPLVVNQVQGADNGATSKDSTNQSFTWA